LTDLLVSCTPTLAARFSAAFCLELGRAQAGSPQQLCNTFGSGATAECRFLLKSAGRARSVSDRSALSHPRILIGRIVLSAAAQHDSPEAALRRLEADNPTRRTRASHERQ